MQGSEVVRHACWIRRSKKIRIETAHTVRSCIEYSYSQLSSSTQHRTSSSELCLALQFASKTLTRLLYCLPREPTYFEDPGCDPHVNTHSRQPRLNGGSQPPERIQANDATAQILAVAFPVRFQKYDIWCRPAVQGTPRCSFWRTTRQTPFRTSQPE